MNRPEQPPTQPLDEATRRNIQSESVLSAFNDVYYYHTLQVPYQPTSNSGKSTIRDSIRGVQGILVSDWAYLFFQTAFFLSGFAFFMSTHIVLLFVPPSNEGERFSIISGKT